jgi:hypothetical protein
MDSKTYMALFCTKRLCVGLCGCLILLMLGGCGDGKPRRYEISGTVLFLGQPLDQGSILFVPRSADVSESGAPIRQGKYVVPQSHGLAPGTYEVRISSPEPGTDVRKELDPEQAGGEPYPIRRERIPSRYNTKSELRIEVKDSGPFTFDFDLKAK